MYHSNYLDIQIDFPYISIWYVHEIWRFGTRVEPASSVVLRAINQNFSLLYYVLGKLLAALVVVFSHHVAFATAAAASSVVANPQKLTVGMTHSVR